VRVIVLTDFPDERFAPGSVLYLGGEDDPAPRQVVVLSSRPHHDILLVRFDAAQDRDAAEALVGSYVRVPVSEAMPLETGSFYEHELVGLEVVLADGSAIGEVVGLTDTGSADVLEVRSGGGRVYLVPMTAEFVSSIDVGAKRIEITPLPGLLD